MPAGGSRTQGECVPVIVLVAVEVLVQLVGWTTVVVITRRARMLRYRHRAPWHWMATGVACYMVGRAALYVHGAMAHSVPPFPSVADLGFLAGTLSMIIGTALIIRQRSTGDGHDEMLDAVVAMSGIGAILWAYAAAPAILNDSMTKAQQGLTITYLLLDVLCLGLLVLLAIGEGVRTPCYYGLAGSMAVIVGIDVYINVVGVGNGFAPSSVLAFLALALLLASVLHPSMPLLTEPPSRSQQSPKTWRTALIIGSLLPAPAILVAELNNRDPVVLAGPMIAWIVLSLLVIVLRLQRDIGMARAREHLTRTLHDGVLQALAIIERDASDDHVARIAREQERKLREFLFGDAERSQGSVQLMPVIHEAVAQFEANYGARTEILLANDLPTLCPQRTEALVGAMGEALTNAGKHGKAAHVTIYAEPGENQGVFCSIKDNGVGSDSATTSEGFGILRSIRARMAELGGTAIIDSSPGSGTVVRIWLP